MKLRFFLTTFLIATCISCDKETPIETNNATTENELIAKYPVSEPLHFDSVESLAMSMRNGLPFGNSKATSFVSYAETVMNEPGYDDRPNAILSTRFGSILNSEGEVEFGSYVLKVTEWGILYGPEQKEELVRELANSSELLSLCIETTICQELNPNETFYKVSGYDDIVLFDTFHYLTSVDTNKRFEPVATKSPAANLETYYLQGALGNFTRPLPGDQKVTFADESYCNDTKVFQQGYGALSDGGLKTKTMKRNSLGIWNKISNQIEGGILGFSVFEYGSFDNIGVGAPDINKVKYENTVKYIYTVNARGSSPQSRVGANITGRLSEGQALAASHNLQVTIEGVRFVINDTNAVTVFVDQRDSGNYDKIDYNWPVPLDGDTTVSQSYLGNTLVPNYASYYVVGFHAYGQSTRGSEIEGSEVWHYYWY